MVERKGEERRGEKERGIERKLEREREREREPAASKLTTSGVSVTGTFINY